MKVVIDTNVMVSAISPFSPYHIIFSKLQNGSFSLLISTEIYLEYLEVIQMRSKKENIALLQGIILYAEQVILIEPTYRWDLIKEDRDDNKFVDCAIAGNADFIITSDRDFNILKDISFPGVIAIHPDEFIKMLHNEDDIS